MRSSALLIATVTAFAVVGCGGSSNNAGHTTPAAGGSTPATPSTATTTTTSAPTTSAAATTTASTSTTAAAPASPPICRAADLSGAFLGGQAATGHGLLGFSLHNVSGHTCVTVGYPGIQFLTQSGHSLPTTPVHTTQDFFGSLTNHPLSVSPGATVSFRLGVTHGAASTNGCTTAYALQVIPPNDTATLRITIANGAYECQTATVSPMQIGTTAYP